MLRPQAMVHKCNNCLEKPTL